MVEIRAGRTWDASEGRLPPPRDNSHIPKAIPDHTRAIGAGVVPKRILNAPDIRWRYRLLGLAISRSCRRGRLGLTSSWHE
jgi:hypothetical protein